MEQNGKDDGGDGKAQSPPVATAASKSPKKRRKVNHACVYCRRSHMTCDLERPCARCIKRNIGHLCHDEYKESDAAAKKAKTRAGSQGEEENTSLEQSLSNHESGLSSYEQRPTSSQDDDAEASATHNTDLEIVQPTPVSAIQTNALNSNSNQFIGYSNDWLGTQDQFQDMHNYHPSYMFNAPEVTNEYNLLNDFLNNSLLDDGALLDNGPFYGDTNSLLGGMDIAQASNPQMIPGLLGVQPSPGITRPPSAIPPSDKTREYYLQAADPTGNDGPEERMQKLLRAKYDAGMLKPFNYVKGYARLSAYMDGHMSAAAKQKILKQLDRFRPMFREKVHTLTDMELTYVEMWFERTLMEYDRVFASMAIPACCWRRTGEIYRGNKEMAELIHVPIEKLRDGKIAIFEILTEESLVNYWEKFGVVAFDQKQKALLTSCSLKNPVDGSKDQPIKCCFSFTIRRDQNKIPCLIVGNFLPSD